MNGSCVCVQTPVRKEGPQRRLTTEPPDGGVCEVTHKQRRGKNRVLFVLLTLYFTSRVVRSMIGFASTLLANSEVADGGS